MPESVSKGIHTRMEKQTKVLSYLNPRPESPFQYWQGYPGLAQIVDATPIILCELYRILTSHTWCEYGNGIYEEQPEFSDMNGEEAIQYLRQRYHTIQNNGKWRLFGLIAHGKAITENITQAPETYRLGNQVSGVLSVGFSLLEAGGQTDIHRGYDSSFYRFHLPLVVPKTDNGSTNCFLWIDGRRVDWSEPFMFDDTRIHGAWNLTRQDRYVLIIDVLR